MLNGSFACAAVSAAWQWHLIASLFQVLRIDGLLFIIAVILNAIHSFCCCWQRAGKAWPGLQQAMQ